MRTGAGLGARGSGRVVRWGAAVEGVDTLARAKGLDRAVRLCELYVVERAPRGEDTPVCVCVCVGVGVCVCVWET